MAAAETRLPSFDKHFGSTDQCIIAGAVYPRPSETRVGHGATIERGRQWLIAQVTLVGGHDLIARALIVVLGVNVVGEAAATWTFDWAELS